MQYTLSEIAKHINGEDYIIKNDIISHVFIDSRNILNSPSNLFFAINGKNNNGHDYIPDLIASGVSNFVIEDKSHIKEHPKCNFILVENSLAAFQELACFHRNKHELPVVGITGSNGKTIVKEWLFYLLNEEKNIVRNPKSYNSQVGVPLSILLIEEQHQLGIFEAGISEPGEMERLAQIIAPQFGILTNIGDAHQENFESRNQKIDEKIKLFRNCDVIIYNSDNLIVDKKLKNIKTKNQALFSWSKKGKGKLNITKIDRKNNKSLITASYQAKKYSISIPYQDEASIENAITAWSFLLAANLFNHAVATKFETLPVIGMRLELMSGINNCTIINDSYNSDLNSIKIALDLLNRQKQHQKKSLIISDILQSGENEKALSEKLNNLLDSSDLEYIFGVGKKIKLSLAKSKTKSYFYNNTTELIQSNILSKLTNHAILVKGAREFQFEKISEFLQHKTHRTVLEISLEALENNLNYFRSLLKPQTKILVMVKAFSYGSGSFEIAHFLEHQRIDYLGVAFTDEGIALRKAGVKLPILVLNPEEGSYKKIVEYQLEPEIHSFKSMQQFHNTIEASYRGQYPIHLKLDTGMKRLGFDIEDVDEIINCLKHYKYLHVKSVMSHLVASDDSLHNDFSKQQIHKFEAATEKLQKEVNHSFIKHILNSGGIENFPEAQFNMVRLGIGLYGISSKQNIKLSNISTLKSHISQIRNVKKEESVGYSRKGRLDKDSKIAILPIGYADGLNRKLGNGNAYVLINGEKAPYVGNICMDMCMVDISDISAKEGDEVIIFGQDLPITYLAEQLNTIPYEILTSVSQRVKRIYMH